MHAPWKPDISETLIPKSLNGLSVQPVWTVHIFCRSLPIQSKFSTFSSVFHSRLSFEAMNSKVVGLLAEWSEKDNLEQVKKVHAQLTTAQMHCRQINGSTEQWTDGHTHLSSKGKERFYE